MIFFSYIFYVNLQKHKKKLVKNHFLIFFMKEFAIKISQRKNLVIYRQEE